MMKKSFLPALLVGLTVIASLGCSEDKGTNSSVLPPPPSREEGNGKIIIEGGRKNTENPPVSSPTTMTTLGRCGDGRCDLGETCNVDCPGIDSPETDPQGPNRVVIMPTSSLNPRQPAPPATPTPSCEPATYDDDDRVAVPLVLMAWEHIDQTGQWRTFIQNTSYVGNDLNDKITLISVYKGPNYREGDVVTVYADSDFRASAHRTFGPGELIRIDDFNDTISSIRFIRGTERSSTVDPTVCPDHRNNDPLWWPSPIALIAELYEHPNFDGEKRTLIGGHIPDLGFHQMVCGSFGCRWFLAGLAFNNRLSSVKVQKGPAYRENAKLTLYSQPLFSGNTIDMAPNDDSSGGENYRDLTYLGFNDDAMSLTMGE